MHVILVVFHKLLQRIIRRYRNRSNFFNNFFITKQISTTSLLRNLEKINSYGSSLNSTETLPFLQSIIAPQVLRKGLPKIMGQKLSLTEPCTRKSVGYFTFPHKTSTSLIMPIGEIVALFAR